jgi:methanogenic corrinoid protein MtbC1
MADEFRAAIDAILDAVDRFDLEAVEREVERLPSVGSPLEVLEHVIVPVLRSVGDRWFTGEVSVAQEHLLSQHVDGLMHDYLRVAAKGERTVIVACFDEEQHHLGALAVAVHLATWGIRPAFFGARTPPEALARGIDALRPDAIALSITITPNRARGSAVWARRRSRISCEAPEVSP